MLVVKHFLFARIVKAWAYVWAGDTSTLLPEDWQLNQFYKVEPGWSEFLQMSKDFKIQYEAQGAASRLQARES